MQPGNKGLSINLCHFEGKFILVHFIASNARKMVSSIFFLLDFTLSTVERLSSLTSNKNNFRQTPLVRCTFFSHAWDSNKRLKCVDAKCRNYNRISCSKKTNAVFVNEFKTTVNISRISDGPTGKMCWNILSFLTGCKLQTVWLNSFLKGSYFYSRHIFLRQKREVQKCVRSHFSAGAH